MCFRVLIACALLATVASSLASWPWCISYFNEASGGSHRGYRQVLGSSYDWGQGGLVLRDWLIEHPGNTSIQIVLDPTGYHHSICVLLGLYREVPSEPPECLILSGTCVATTTEPFSAAFVLSDYTTTDVLGGTLFVMHRHHDKSRPR